MDVNCRSQGCRALHTDELPHNCVFVQAALCKQKTRFVKIVVDRSGGNSVVFQIFCDCDDEGLTINNCGRWGFRLCEASDCEHFENLVLIVLGKCAKEEESGGNPSLAVLRKFCGKCSSKMFTGWPRMQRMTQRGTSRALGQWWSVGRCHCRSPVLFNEVQWNAAAACNAIARQKCNKGGFQASKKQQLGNT